MDFFGVFVFKDGFGYVYYGWVSGMEKVVGVNDYVGILFVKFGFVYMVISCWNNDNGNMGVFFVESLVEFMDIFI